MTSPNRDPELTHDITAEVTRVNTVSDADGMLLYKFSDSFEANLDDALMGEESTQHRLLMLHNAAVEVEGRIYKHDHLIPRQVRSIGYLTTGLAAGALALEGLRTRNFVWGFGAAAAFFVGAVVTESSASFGAFYEDAEEDKAKLDSLKYHLRRLSPRKDAEPQPDEIEE